MYTYKPNNNNKSRYFMLFANNSPVLCDNQLVNVIKRSVQAI